MFELPYQVKLSLGRDVPSQCRVVGCPIYCDLDNLIIISSMCHNHVCQVLEKLLGIFNFIKHVNTCNKSDNCSIESNDPVNSMFIYATLHYLNKLLYSHLCDLLLFVIFLKNDSFTSFPFWNYWGFLHYVLTFSSLDTVSR